MNQQCWILEHIPFVLWKHPIYIATYWCISIANWFLYLYAQEIALCKRCCQRNGWNQYEIRPWTLQIYASTRQTDPFWKALFSYHFNRIHNLFSQSNKEKPVFRDSSKCCGKIYYKKNVVLLFMKRFILTCRKLSYICAVYMQSWTSVRFLHKTFFYHNHVAYFIMMPRQIHFIWHAKNDHKKSHKDKVRRPFPSHASAL